MKVERGDCMQEKPYSYVLVLRGERGKKIFDKIASLPPRDRSKDRQKIEEIKKKLIAQGMKF